MKTRLAILAAVAAALLSSCSTLQYHYSEARIAEANTDVFVIPPTVRVNVNPEGFVDTWVFEGRDLKSIATPGIDIETLTQRLKVAATNKSLQKHEGDILVAPIFDIVSEHDGHRYTVTIRSHIGYFTDWNKDTEDYLEIQKSYRSVEAIVN
ncbi:MAG: hypothetical protein IJL48_03395 [Bacteroidales bacterium]|nr:hypothetical protein [Bacteroidales bacterium]